MSWRGIPITGGVVNTRKPSALSPGEYEYARNMRLVAGDSVEVRRDYGRSQIVAVASPEEIVHMFVAAFESAGEFVVLVTKDSTNLYIKTTPIGSATLAQQAEYPHGGDVTKAWHVKRGDQYFIGTDATVNNPRINLVLGSDLSVRYMGMRPSSQAQSGTPAQVAGSSAALQDDVFVYWITEYDGTNDLESGNSRIYSDIWFGWVSLNSIQKVTISANGNTIEDLRWGNGSTTNSTATKQRVYRHFCGNGSVGDEIAAGYADGSEELVGGFVGEIDPGDPFTDSLDYRLDKSPEFPIIYYERAGTVLTDQTFTYPQKWNIGTLFNDSVVVTDGTLIRFGPPAGPEYQPSINVSYFLTDRNDEIVGMHAINGVLLVMTLGGAHRIDYLAHEADIAARLGRATRTVSKLDGCVGRYASCPLSIEGESREFVAFLSHTGLRMTDGERVYDACPDWSVSGAGISGSDLANCVLVPDPANHRLRLYVPGASASTIWDFYYHASLLRGGRLRCFGGSTHDAVVKFAAYGYVSGVPTLFTASTTTVYREGVGEIGGSMDALTGWIRPSSPFSEIQLDSVAIEHDADSAGTVTMTGYGKSNEGPETSAGGTKASGDYEETTQVASAGCRGAYVRAKVSVTGHSRLGTLWLDAKEDLGGAA